MLGTWCGPAGTRFSDSGDPIFSDSRDTFCNSRDPNRVPKAPSKSPGLTTVDVSD